MLNVEASCNKDLVEFGQPVSATYTRGQTNRHTDKLIAILCFPTGAEARFTVRGMIGYCKFIVTTEMRFFAVSSKIAIALYL